MTEQVTGIDLVREQIRIAAGQPLSFSQEDVRWRGHALQCRVYAEDPRAGFRPAAGPVLLCEPPQGAGIRNDVGVETGDVASVRYDPLLAKLTVWAPDRPAALARAARGAAPLRHARRHHQPPPAASDRRRSRLPARGVGHRNPGAPAP